MMALSISAVIWSVSLGSVSTVEQTQSSRSHTGTHTICSMNTMLDTTCITPHTSSPDVSLTLAAHPSHPWSIIPAYCEQIILKIVHCNWPRTLARLSYLNISTKHVWNRTLTGTFCKYRAERGGREAAAGLANTITARGRTSGQTAACSSLI